MNKNTTKNFRVFALIFILSALLIGTFCASVKAQDQATIVVMAAVGGTTDPTGTTTYADGTAVTLTATAGEGFVFQNWEIITSAGGITDSTNPTTLTVNATVGTYAVQAVFQPVQVITPATITSANNAIVVVLAAVGGTTSPAPGTYALANAAALELKATPNSGFVFHNWIIGGTPLSHGAYSFTDTPTDNPYNVNHGYGYTYTYQPVFVPTGSTVVTTGSTPTPSPSSMSTDAWIIIAALIVIIVIVLIALVVVYTQKSKKEVK
jgi:hypothetical protein